MIPIRLRDFIEDPDGWLYAVSTYDNTDKVGCVLRYVPRRKRGTTRFFRQKVPEIRFRRCIR